VSQYLLREADMTTTRTGGPSADSLGQPLFPGIRPGGTRRPAGSTTGRPSRAAGAAAEITWGQEFGGLDAPGLVKPFVQAAVRARPKRLWEVIPDDPDYQKYIPINYRLDATRLVGGLAQDLQRGKSAHFWVELTEWGLNTAEIFELLSATGSLVAGLLGPFLGTAASFLALGAGYQEAWEKIAEEKAASGYSRGAVMGANKRSPGLLREYYGHLTFSYPGNEHGARVAKVTHNAGLVTGYLHGRALRQNQRVIFWHDLGRRMPDQSHRGPQSQWRQQDWSEWYGEAAAAFRRDHLTA
jgi:hypothetical protein